ncbi:MAG: ABC transporter substrate-binding protein [Lachnospiraceae bacterium]|nr:ABC transporter substrate-binding protein [Lachnospiraceae bacterium]
MKKTMLPLIIAGSMLFTGCGGGEVVVSDPSESAQEPAVSEAGTDPASEEKEAVYGPLVIGAETDGAYNPFFSADEDDDIITKLLHVRLLENDRRGAIVYHGIEGEIIPYNGTDYSYSGIADCDVNAAEDGSVTYSFKLRDDVCFSDGEKLTADDVIFTYYVFCDPSYDGAGLIGSLPIRGLKEYRDGYSTLLDIMCEKGEENTDFELYTEEEQKTFFEKDLPEAGAAFAESIAEYCIEQGRVTGIEKIDKCPAANAMANWGYASVNADESITAVDSGKNWTMDGEDVPSAADFFDEMLLVYKGDLKKLSDSEKAGQGLEEFLPDKYRNAVCTGESAGQIEGIVRTGDESFEITLDRADASAIYTLNCYILPLHVYGDEKAYDAGSAFGFTKGDLSAQRCAADHVGAGPYVLEAAEEGGYSFRANGLYYKGCPLTEEIKLCDVSGKDIAAAMTAGELDVYCSGPDRTIAEDVKKANGGDTESASKIKAVRMDAESYGYIGMNLQRVKVGDEPLSAESKYYRRAIATVMSAYREDAVRSYYGETARLIQYPVSDTGIIPGEAADPAYAAFSTDSSSRPIYSDNMNEDQRTEAALKAALKYFELAGFLSDDGKLIAAPEGAALKLEAMVSGGGLGDHPAMDILTKSSSALRKIGFELQVTDLEDVYQLWTNIEGGLADLWCAAWPSGIYPDMFDVYHSEGRSAYMYRIYDKELDELIDAARYETDPEKQPEECMNCLDHIIDLAVELPLYRRQGNCLFSVEKVKISTIPAEMTLYYDYFNEIEKLQIKASTL